MSTSDPINNFLWPYEHDSIEEAAYEFSNGLVEVYREEWWNILQERIREKALYEISAIISERHGDDIAYMEPIDEERDTPAEITIKKIFAILDKDKEE